MKKMLSRDQTPPGLPLQTVPAGVEALLAVRWMDSVQVSLLLVVEVALPMPMPASFSIPPEPEVLGWEMAEVVH